MTRVLAIGLDGYDLPLFDDMMAAGELPALARLRDRSARVRLEHGVAQRSGLGWEQFAMGLDPDASGHHTAVHFDRHRYKVNHESARLPPFAAALPARTVVFDVPYFDLARAPEVRGIVCWGAHDPGIPPGGRPAGLFKELDDKVGAYAAPEWTYGFAWPSAARSRAMGEGLARAIDQRSDAAIWLLRDRLPDWDLALLVVGELHGAFEGLWHGVDPRHPLHAAPSAGAAAEALKQAIRASDRLVGRLCEAFPDAAVVCFAQHGMGPNGSDVPSMVLLPELMFRAETGGRLLKDVAGRRPMMNGAPMLAEDEAWQPPIMGDEKRQSTLALRRAVKSLLGARLTRAVARTREGLSSRFSPSRGRSLDWMAAVRYQTYWPRMRAFAVPSFYDGRIRINLAGREAAGLVRRDEYEAEVERIVALVQSCVNPATGDCVVAGIERPRHADPNDLDPTEADITILWHGAPLAFQHPDHGVMGPLPYRRTGGHTGELGFAFVSADGILVGDHGLRSTFDVVPTIVSLVGVEPVAALSGQSFLAAILNAIPA